MELRSLWSFSLPGPLSAPVVAEGTLLVAVKDTHQIVALDAETGKMRWVYTAGARIDSPPTIYQGRALFGCRDGWVHCLRLDDGELIWRFHAAPAEQFIMVGGQLESSWPVSGSVLIADDVAYFAVGRLVTPEDGPCVYGLDPRTGKILRQEKVKTPTLCDVLAADQRTIHVGETVIELEKSIDTSSAWQGHLRPFCVERKGAYHSLLDGSWYKRRDVSDARGMIAQRLVFTRTRSFGFLVGDYGPGTKLHIADLPRPGRSEYQLFALDAVKQQLLWKTQVSMRVSALLATNELVFVGGSPDPAPGAAPKEAELSVVSAVDGKQLNRLRLPTPVVDDGLAAVGGRLYVCREDGTVQCLGNK